MTQEFTAPKATDSNSSTSNSATSGEPSASRREFLRTTAALSAAAALGPLASFQSAHAAGREGLNLMDFASRTYGLAFGTEMGMYGTFDGRVKLAMITVRTATSVFAERYK